MDFLILNIYLPQKIQACNILCLSLSLPLLQIYIYLSFYYEFLQ